MLIIVHSLNDAFYQEKEFWYLANGRKHIAATFSKNRGNFLIGRRHNIFEEKLKFC